MPEQHRGSCLCGEVSYEIRGALRPVVACHCRQCQKTSGSYVMASQCQAADLVIIGESLKWFTSSETAERGFCGTCGSNLFWRRFGKDYVSIFAGGLDLPTGLVLESQIHCESKGDYYSLPEVQQVEQSQLN
ncbi:GFA family protein [Aliamphritea spongicola]|uniref:GFA family protein n=1 Tax=Aliamphritea spongicola TaxID=707589 RepID=UPI00196B054E|nr:GFA family protein [Aliamphritea spongicola]MBN3561182.1 GFA family protein [Aliamphritea spongicola]